MTKVVDPWTWREMSLPKWRSEVSQRLESVYLINLDAAGLDDEYLSPHWELKQSPYEFVEWYALKRDLEPKSAFWL